jgi:hypothetical protein
LPRKKRLEITTTTTPKGATIREKCHVSTGSG